MTLLTDSLNQSFQKDAILRQMKEYKREKQLYESQVQDLTKRSQHHDDHLRIIDAWFTQVSLIPLLRPHSVPDTDALGFCSCSMRFELSLAT